jgi:uncharacterized membrane-anchored protein
MPTDAKGLGAALSKVPQVTLAFWVIKILATTLGETGGDALSMQLGLGYLVSTFIFLAFFVVALVVQVAARRFHPLAYWACVVATTTVGTTTSDLFDRTFGLGYIKSSIVLFIGVVVVLAIWRAVMGRLQFEKIADRRDEAFYWVTILISNTLGTALGDFTADDLGLGFEGGALLFAGLIAVVGALHLWTKVPKAILFWAAYVLTRPLGATAGDLLTKPFDHGGLNLNRIGASLVILVLMAVGVWLTERWQARASARAEEGAA